MLWHWNVEVATDLSCQHIGNFRMAWDSRRMIVRRIHIDRVSPTFAQQYTSVVLKMLGKRYSLHEGSESHIERFAYH
jgi:hypothetical protein